MIPPIPWVIRTNHRISLSALETGGSSGRPWTNFGTSPIILDLSVFGDRNQVVAHQLGI